MSITHSALLPAIYCLAILPATAQPNKDEPKVVKYRLDNGLTVILRPVTGAKETALVVLFAIGGDHDPQGRSGLAHVLEHLYCTAAAGEIPAREYTDILKRYPRGSNHQTGERYTVHAVIFGQKELERELKDAAARMGQLKIADSDLARELPRVEEELNMYGGIPALAASNLAREKIHPAPLGGQRGGLIDHVKAIKLDELQKRWRDYYRPDNAIIVLAGAVDVAETRKMITTLFATIAPAKKLPQLQTTGKPVLGKMEEVAVKAAFPTAEKVMSIAFRAPAPSSELYAPFLVTVARMFQQRSKLETDVKRFPISWAPLDDPEIIYFNLPVSKETTADELRTRVRKFLSMIGEAEVTAADQRTAAAYFGRLLGLMELPDTLLTEDPYGVAFGLGRREQLGIDAVQLKKAVEAVTTKDLQRVMKEVFGEDKGAGVLVRPK